MSLPIPCFLLLGLGLVIAAVCDLKRRRIPNALTLALLVVGLAAQGIFHGPVAALSGLAAGVIVILALYLPWNAGGIGGGDVKLAAATATWLGFSHIIPFALATAIAGGVVALVCYVVARPGTRAEVRANVTLAVLQGELPAAPSHRTGHLSVPYALAIAAGAAIACFITR
jgi:prepilin peptidase CpaA